MQFQPIAYLAINIFVSGCHVQQTGQSHPNIIFYYDTIWNAQRHLSETSRGRRALTFSVDPLSNGPLRSHPSVPVRNAAFFDDLCPRAHVLRSRASLSVLGFLSPPSPLGAPALLLDNDTRFAPVFGTLHSNNVCCRARVRNAAFEHLLPCCWIDFASFALSNLCVMIRCHSRMPVQHCFFLINARTRCREKCQYLMPKPLTKR
jgi:hypothetical protein